MTSLAVALVTKPLADDVTYGNSITTNYIAVVSIYVACVCVKHVLRYCGALIQILYLHQQPGQGGQAPQPEAPEREHPQQATKNPTKRYPQGCLRGGGDEHPNWTELPVTTQANGELNTSTVCICSKVCKNLKSLKIHQAKMAYLRRDQVKLRSGQLVAEPGET